MEFILLLIPKEKWEICVGFPQGTIVWHVIGENYTFCWYLCFSLLFLYSAVCEKFLLEFLFLGKMFLNDTAWIFVGKKWIIAIDFVLFFIKKCLTKLWQIKTSTKSFLNLHHKRKDPSAPPRSHTSPPTSSPIFLLFIACMHRKEYVASKLH